MGWDTSDVVTGSGMTWVTLSPLMRCLYTVDTSESTAQGGNKGPLRGYRVYHCGTVSRVAAPIMLLSFLQRPVSWSCIRGSGLRQLCPRLELPVVLGSTLASVLGELSSLVDGLHDGLVLGVEGDSLDDVVHLVPHLGSSEVVICRYWGLAGSSEKEKCLRWMFWFSSRVFSVAFNGCIISSVFGLLCNNHWHCSWHTCRIFTQTCYTSLSSGVFWKVMWCNAPHFFLDFVRIYALYVTKNGREWVFSKPQEFI